MSKLICAVVKQQLNADGSVAIKEGAIVICNKAYSEKKKCDFYQVFTDNISSESEKMNFGISVEKFESDFLTIGTVGSAPVEDNSEAIAALNSEILTLSQTILIQADEVKMKEATIQQLNKELDAIKKSAVVPGPGILAKTEQSCGFFRALESSVGSINRLEIMLLSFGDKLKGSIIVNDLPGYEINGTVTELDEELIKLIGTIQKENAFIISNINQYSQLLREKEEALRKQAEAANKKPVDAPAKTKAAKAEVEAKAAEKSKKEPEPSMFKEEPANEESGDEEPGYEVSGNEATEKEMC